jgi:hypothetical protein
VTDKVIGLSDLDHALGELPKTTAKNTLRRTGLKALEPFVAKVRSMAPVDADPESSPKRPPGTLRDSYIAGTKLNKSQAKTAKREGKSFVEVYAGTNDAAGVQTEFGNAHQSPQPHARPAWDGTQMQVLELVGFGLFEEIMKAAARLAKKAAKGR